MRFFRLLFLVCVAGFATQLAGSAAAERRVAMVIGNGAYAKVPKLINPTNDATAVEIMFKAAGFDKVVRATDLGLQQMRRVLRDFADEARDADLAVVFYAGHGMEMNGTNYLIPVDAVLERDIDVADETVSLDRVNMVLEPAKRLRLVILDACRDNPFVRSMRRTLAGRAIGRGLAQIEVTTTDTLVAYAAKAGSTAADGDAANSPYTTALTKHLTTPGLDVRLALGRVRDDVLRATGRRQEPFVYGSLGGAEMPLVAAPAVPAPLPRVAPVSGDAGAVAQAWGLVTQSTDIRALEAFRRQFGDANPFFDHLAAARIGELRKAEEQRRVAALKVEEDRQKAAVAAATEVKKHNEDAKLEYGSDTVAPTDSKAGHNKGNVDDARAPFPLSGLIKPGRAVGPISIGMREQQVVAAWGKPRERVALALANLVSLRYNERNIEVYLNTKSDRVESIIIHSGAAVTFASDIRMGSSKDEILKQLGSPVKQFDDQGPRGGKVVMYRGITFVFNGSGHINYVGIAAPQ